MRRSMVFVLAAGCGFQHGNVTGGGSGDGGVTDTQGPVDIMQPADT